MRARPGCEPSLLTNDGHQVVGLQVFKFPSLFLISELQTLDAVAGLPNS
jgi:hypothetical protein